MEINGISDVVGVILAGGRSSRFGRNKALEPVEHSPLIQRVVNSLQGIFGDLLVVTNQPEAYAFLGVEVIKDRIEGLGPIGGIYTGLKHIYPKKGFFFPCDMPMLNTGLICYMMDLMKDGLDILVPRVGEGLFEPLHAIYGPKCICKIEDLLEQKRLRVYYLFEELRVRYVELEELKRIDPELEAFTNINTETDLLRVLQGAKDKTLFA